MYNSFPYIRPHIGGLSIRESQIRHLQYFDLYYGLILVSNEILGFKSSDFNLELRVSFSVERLVAFQYNVTYKSTERLRFHSKAHINSHNVKLISRELFRSEFGIIYEFFS